MTSDQLSEHLCFYASFQNSPDADKCRGDGTASVNSNCVSHDPNGGRNGGAMVFAARDNGWAEDELTFPAAGNFPYCEAGFDGTISLWLKGDPDADLHPEFPVDPFHISRHPADGSYYLDLTKPNDWRYGSPRKLRFGFYDDSPAQDMFKNGHLIVVGELGWDDGQWHHIAATWRNSNSGKANGEAAVYIDGRLRGTMSGYEHRLTWNIDELRIGLGQRYVGAICDFSIYDAALTVEQIRELL